MYQKVYHGLIKIRVSTLASCTDISANEFDSLKLRDSQFSINNSSRSADNEGESIYAEHSRFES